MNKKLRIYGSFEDVEIVEDFKEKDITANKGANFIYLKGRIMTCDEPNANGDYFSAEEVKASYESFIGGIVDYNHDNNIILGRIIDATYVEEKEQKDWVEIICKINKKAYTDIVEQVEAGILNQVSLEAFADEAECSICGHVFDFIERQPCEHISGGLMRNIVCDDGVKRTVYKKDKKLTFTGAGVVPNPADKNADIENIIARAKENASEGKINEAKETIDELMAEESTLKQALTKLNGLEFISVLDAVKNKENGTTKTIASEISENIEEGDVLTEKEFYDILSSKYNKLTTIEIEDIKGELKTNNKLLNSDYNAYLVTMEKEEPYWMITKNELPQFKTPLSNIWGDELKQNIKIDGQSLNEYAKSNMFRKRLLLAIQKEGINYVKEIWGISKKDKENMQKDLLDEIKLIGKEMFNMDVIAKDAVVELSNSLNIEASKTFYVKDKFCECVANNLENEKIESKKGQSQQDAVESYCFNSVINGGKILASQKEYNIWDMFWKIMSKNSEKYKNNKGYAWLEYKIKGKWHKNTTKKILTKAFAIENKNKLKQFNIFNDNKDYFMNLGFEKNFIDNYGILASKKDIDSLLNAGFNKENIKKLIKLRFMGQ